MLLSVVIRFFNLAKEPLDDCILACYPSVISGSVGPRLYYQSFPLRCRCSDLTFLSSHGVQIRLVTRITILPNLLPEYTYLIQPQPISAPTAPLGPTLSRPPCPLRCVPAFNAAQCTIQID